MKESLCIENVYPGDLSIQHFYADSNVDFFSCWCQQALKQAKNVFLAYFRAYVGQPDNHKGWATSMPFASIYPTHQSTNPWYFCKEYWELDELKSFFESSPWPLNGEFPNKMKKKSSAGISVNPMRTERDRLCPPYYYRPPIFLDDAASL